MSTVCMGDLWKVSPRLSTSSFASSRLWIELYVPSLHVPSLSFVASLLLLYCVTAKHCCLHPTDFHQNCMHHPHLFSALYSPVRQRGLMRKRRKKVGWLNMMIMCRFFWCIWKRILCCRSSVAKKKILFQNTEKVNDWNIWMKTGR